MYISCEPDTFNDERDPTVIFLTPTPTPTRIFAPTRTTIRQPQQLLLH